MSSRRRGLLLRENSRSAEKGEGQRQGQSKQACQDPAHSQNKQTGRQRRETPRTQAKPSECADTRRHGKYNRSFGNIDADMRRQVVFVDFSRNTTWRGQARTYANASRFRRGHWRTFADTSRTSRKRSKFAGHGSKTTRRTQA